MRVINLRNIKIGDKIGLGAHSVVRKCNIDNKEYAIKLLNYTYPKNIVDNIYKMTDMSFNENFIAPLYVVENSAGDFLGYITKYNKNIVSSNKIIDYETKISFLKKAKVLVENLHNEYKLVHGDLVDENMLYNKENKNSYLIDFDTAISIGESYEKIQLVRLFLQDYLKYYKVDESMDAYLFNTTTLSMLGNYDYLEVLFSNIECEEFTKFNKNGSNIILENKDVKRLTKELLLNDTSKKYSGEYIIDYL